MAKNSFISSFNHKEVFDFLKWIRPFVVVVVVLGAVSFWVLGVADVAQEGTKQVVRLKRLWARDTRVSRQAQGKGVVLFLGNSKVCAGIIPAVFDRVNEGRFFSYNLALPALPLAPHYFLLKDYLQHNPAPKYIVMALSPGGLDHELVPYYALLNAGLGEVISYSILRKDVDILVNYLFPLRFYWPEVQRYVIGKAVTLFKINQERSRQQYVEAARKEETFRHDWDRVYQLRYSYFEKTSGDRAALLKDNRGYYYIAEQAVVGGALADDYAPPQVKSAPVIKVPAFKAVSQAQDISGNDPFIKKFFDLALKRNIKVILISDYAIKLRSAPAIAATVTVPDTWRMLKEKYRNVRFAGFTPRYYEPGYFSDPVHANSQGAVRYTLEIANEFKKIIYNDVP
ncbi:MAG: hypothetical protein V2A70_04295 [Candidatus Omnitrophota bacterium]